MSVPAWVRAAFGAHYPDLYRHRDDTEAARCIALVDRLVGLAGGRVLDLGCGAGRHLTPLAELGCRGAGLDQSEDLLRLATDLPVVRDGVFRLSRGDWSRLPYADASFDAVLSLFTAFGYGDDEDHVRMTVEIARVLEPGGRWVLDYFNPRAVRRELATGAPPREREIAGRRVREERRLNAAGDRVEKTVTVSDGEGAADLTYVESVALLDLDLLDDLAARAGLRRTDGAGDYAGAPLDPDASPRWLLVFAKEASS